MLLYLFEPCPQNLSIHAGSTHSLAQKKNPPTTT